MVAGTGGASGDSGPPSAGPITITITITLITITITIRLITIIAIIINIIRTYCY